MVGVGTWGKNLARALMSSTDTTIAQFVYGGSQETNDWLLEHFPQIPRTLSFEDVCNDPAIDAVIIATPIHTHASLVRDALMAHKHVFVEKPLATDPKTVAELYQLANGRNLTLFTGYLYRYDPAFVALEHTLVSKNDLTLTSVWEKYGTFETPITLNLLVHELALATVLLGPLSLLERVRHDTDHIVLSVRGVRGRAHISIDRTQQEKKKILTALTDGHTYELTPGSLIERTATGENTIAHFPDNKLLDHELVLFLHELSDEHSDNKKRQLIDESIAAVLEELG